MLPGGQPNFDTYAIQAKAYVAERRHYVTDDHVAEIEGNSPFEIRPKNPNGQAVLMIHGLGDSPWTFTDLGKTLADQGYLVRTMLLPGHGTRPADMIGNGNTKSFAHAHACNADCSQRAPRGSC